ncbi:MAG: HpsJ family protein [Pseudanabaenaceae cyanobacterium bins.39]|nr:HpsJ family protein [Pseudanabaenaceae cyanobacterium bins.39]
MNEVQIPATGKQTYLLLRALGYCSLALSVLDTLILLTPPKFTNSVWELNLYGQMIERIPLILIAFPLIFFGEYTVRMSWESISTKIISWFAMFLAVFYLLGIPLTIVNTFRVQNIRQGEVIARVAQQNGPIQELSERLNQATTDAEIINTIRSLSPQSAFANIPDPQATRLQILSELQSSISKNQTEADNLKRQISMDLWKDSVKWVIAAAFVVLFLIYVWMQSKWARFSISFTNTD